MLLVGNGRLLTRDEKAPWYENGAVAIEGESIADVGEYGALRAKYPEAGFIDAGGGVIMPALTNAHEHIYSAFARGLAINGYNAKNFYEILDGLWWRLDSELTLEDCRASAAIVAADCIRCGVTTIFDHHASYGGTKGSLGAMAGELSAAGLRACLCYEVSDRNGAAAAKEAVEENAEFMDYAAGRPMLRGMMGLHASFTLSDATLAAARAVTPTGAGFHIHVAEGPDDEEDAVARHGMRVVERLAGAGALDEHSLAVHCVNIDEGEIAVLKETGARAVYNPESNMGNAVGAPPVLKMAAAGIEVCLGTDGYTNDMLESYKAAPILQKLWTRDPSVCGELAPNMLFKHNAALASERFGVTLGVLKKGAAADVIVTDYIPPTPMDDKNADYHILFGMAGGSVVTTIAAGCVLMLDRRLLAVDAAAAAAKGRELSAALAKRING